MSNRNDLKSKFKDGDRPAGKDFADLIDSSLNKDSDGLNVDADKNLVLSRGLQLGNSAGTTAGTLRFNSGQVQVNKGGNDWASIASGGGGAFQPFGTTDSITGAVTYAGGNVGIGSFSAAPTYRLEVNLGPNTTTTEQVRFGQVVCSNGAGDFDQHAVFSHRKHASNTNFALRQSPFGDVDINTPTNRPISIRQNGSNTRLAVSAAGNVIIGASGDLPGNSGEVLQVNGLALKMGPSTGWNIFSDERLKEDVQDLDLGLAQLRKVRPVRFRYNGRAATPLGVEGVGVLGQEIEKIFPEMIRRAPGGVDGEPGLEELRIYDGSALTFVLVNAVKELAGKVDQLEQELVKALKKCGNDRNPD
jgi:hypothetical protein